MEDKRKYVWVDCDMEYDDAMEVILTAYNPTLKLLGISTVHGVVTAERSATYAIQVLELAGIEGVGVVRGATESLCRGPRAWEEFNGTSAVDWAKLPPPTGKQVPLKDNAILYMYNTISAVKDRKVILVSTAQFTNIALLLKCFPEVKANIEEIVVMGGAISAGNVDAASEFNVNGDPEAAKIVFNCGLKVVMIPLDVTRKVIVTDAVLDVMKEWHTEFGETCIRLLTFFKTVYAREHTNLHDATTIGYLIDPTILRTELLVVEVECGSSCSDGRTNCDIFHRSKKPKNVHVALDINVDRFWAIMLEALARANEKWKLAHPQH